MAVRKQVEHVRPPVITVSWRELIKLVIAAGIVGIITLVFYVILDKYLFTPTLCSNLNAGTGRCENKLYFASGLAMVLGGIVALFYLVQQRVYRPLLVVLLVTVALWNSLLLIATFPMMGAIISALVLFGFGYAAFAWLVQIRNFIIALIISVILVIVMRLILS